jgi:hypothetical protein
VRTVQAYCQRYLCTLRNRSRNSCSRTANETSCRSDQLPYCRLDRLPLRCPVWLDLCLGNQKRGLGSPESMSSWMTIELRARAGIAADRFSVPFARSYSLLGPQESESLLRLLCISCARSVDNPASQTEKFAFSSWDTGRSYSASALVPECSFCAFHLRPCRHRCPIFRHCTIVV